MKNVLNIWLVTSLLLLSTHHLLAQQKDSVKIEYSTKKLTDTCNSFSCKYNYLIRAKVEEKDLFKLGEGGDYTNINYGWFQFFPIQVSLAYEHKISPAFSILVDTRYEVPEFKEYTLIEGMRYYYNMPRRIRQGKAANNFSGNYISLQHENNFVKSNGSGFIYAPTLDLLYGFQRRLWRYDYMDFSVGLTWRGNISQYDYSSNVIGRYRLVPTANFAIGFAI